MGYSRIFAVVVGLAIVATDFQPVSAAMSKRFQHVEAETTFTPVHHERIIGGIIAGAVIGGAIVHHRNRHHSRRYYRKRHTRALGMCH